MVAEVTTKLLAKQELVPQTECTGFREKAADEKIRNVEMCSQLLSDSSGYLSSADLIIISIEAVENHIGEFVLSCTN